MNQPFTAYPNISFQPGDRVWLDAGGCVQTGGSGKTWKRYVDPDGEAADRRYHGLVFIPGVTPGPVRISGLLGRALDIPVHGVDPWRLSLTLGYEDDDYSDNGYDRPDDGVNDQCRGLTSAWVNVMVQHGVNAVDHGNSTGPKAFDLVWTDTDPNGFPRNPTWSYAASGASGIVDPDSICHLRWTQKGPEQDCSSLKLGIDTPSDLKNHVLGLDVCPPGWIPIVGGTCYLDLCQSPEPINGHLNFGEVVIEGLASKREQDRPNLYADVSIVPIHVDAGIGGDDDVNLYLGPLALSSSPLAIGNRNPAVDAPTVGSIDLEFDSDETTDHYGGVSWWQQFKADANFIRGKYAVAVGLLGFDATHKFTTELHPLHALAVRIAQQTAPDGGIVDEWGYFVRNWGNEGECGQEDHPTVFPANDFSFRLPAPQPGMHPSSFNRGDWVQSGWSSQFPGWSPIVDANGVAQAVAVEFDGFASPLLHPWVAGHFFVTWSPGSCLPPKRLCRGVCFDDQTFVGNHDVHNCGGCGVECPSGGLCAAGSCACPAGQLVCNGVCLDPSSDNGNCGGCGVPCPGTCTAGRCVCPAGTTQCGGTLCADLTSDQNNCGTCGHQCPHAHACVSSACSSSCPSSLPDLCSGACVDVQSDSANCGRCGHKCASGSYCDQGTCFHGKPQ